MFKLAKKSSVTAVSTYEEIFGKSSSREIFGKKCVNIQRNLTILLILRKSCKNDHQKSLQNQEKLHIMCLGDVAWATVLLFRLREK